MRIVIVGGGFRNKGAEAMMRTVQAEFGRRIPDAEFVMWNCPENEREFALSSGLLPVTEPGKGSGWQRVAWLVGRLARSPRRLLGVLRAGDVVNMLRAAEMLEDCGSFDAVVDVSGFAYGDQCAELRSTRAPYGACRRPKRVPVVFMPQSWGSFEIGAIREQTTTLLAHLDSLEFSRDAVSSRHLESILGLPAGAKEPQPDVALAFFGGSTNQGEGLLRAMGCLMNRPVVGLAPNARIYELTEGSGGRNTYIESLSRLVRHLVDHKGVDVVLQANEMRTDAIAPDDRYLCSTVATAACRPGAVFMTRQRLDAESTSALIGQLDLLVSSRFHSLVFALSRGVPAVAVGWSHKYPELMATFGLSEYAIGFEAAESGELTRVVDDALDRRGESMGRIRMIAPDLRRRLCSVFDDSAAFIIEELRHR